MWLTQNLAPADNVLHFKAILECGGYATKAYWQMKLTPVVAISTRTVPLGAAETEEFKPESQAKWREIWNHGFKMQFSELF